MKLKTILAATVLLSVASPAFAKSKHVLTGDAAYQAASALVDYTTRARYALAVNDPVEAKEFIEAAKQSGQTLASLAVDKRKISNIQSGQITYDTNVEKDGASYYYPVEAATVEEKHIAAGPFWKQQINKSFAVKDAQFVYVTVNIAGVDVQKDLNKAEKEIDNKQYEDASDELQDVIEDIVTIEDRKEAYALKAKDNILLARNYLDAQNYDAARYPLNHAKSALESMKGNKRYADQQDLVQKYLNEVDRSEKVIAKNDPNALDKLKAELKTDWEGMKDWADKKMN
jgi:hypothetical protein